MSIVLIVISLGIRVGLTYYLSAHSKHRISGNLAGNSDWLGIGRYR